MSQFIFESYNFDAATKRLEVRYAIDQTYQFTEQYVFDFPFVNYDAKALDRAVQNLFFMAGVSYYKTTLPDEIVIRSGEVDETSATFFSKTWQKGLGEFFYMNKLDPNTPIPFPHTAQSRAQTNITASGGYLVGIGGGKDSLVSVELLRDQPNVSTWSVGHARQLRPLIEAIELPHYSIERIWDPQLVTLNNQPGIMNGHVPISAVLACVGTVAAVLSGRRDVVVSNEASADEPTLMYQNVSINHQYSKSSEFERDYQKQLKADFGESLRYYSLLRPLSELRISEIFAQIGLGKYSTRFSSCNRAFTHTQTEMSWCGNCPKCAFVFLALTPFVRREQLEAVFGGKNLLLEASLEPTYKALLGIEGDKPLDCVGEVKESRAAMRLAQEHYPELSKYTFDLPPDYNFREVQKDLLPVDIREIILPEFQIY
jgi:UDP-N-acetyl-alpha-D-muramoyl-L-alanyl-L-glutamate epimerase